MARRCASLCLINRLGFQDVPHAASAMPCWWCPTVCAGIVKGIVTSFPRSARAKMLARHPDHRIRVTPDGFHRNCIDDAVAPATSVNLGRVTCRSRI